MLGARFPSMEEFVLVQTAAGRQSIHNGAQRTDMQHESRSCVVSVPQNDLASVGRPKICQLDVYRGTS